MQKSGHNKKDAKVICIERAGSRPAVPDQIIAQRNQVVSARVVDILRTMFSSLRAEPQTQRG